MNIAKDKKLHYMCGLGLSLIGGIICYYYLMI